MKLFSTPGIYSLWEVDEPVPWVVVGPNLSEFHDLSNAASNVAEALKDRGTITNFATNFAWAINQAAAVMPAPANALQAGHDEALNFHVHFLKAVGAKTRSVRGSDAVLVIPDRSNHAKVEAALMALARVTAELAEYRFNGADPGRVKKSGGRSYWDPYDTGRRFRVRSNPDLSPRSNDPRIFDRWYASAIELQLSETVIELARLCRLTGCRFVTAAHISLADVFLFASPPTDIPGVSKGSQGQRSLTLSLSELEHEHLVGYARRAWPKVVPDLIAGRSRYGPDELMAMPLFPVSYQRYKSEFDRAARRADLFFPKIFRGQFEMRLVTPHQLRHEYVFEQLGWIEIRPVDERSSLRDGLARQIGWSSGETMLQYYSHFYDIQKAIHASQQRRFEQEDEGPDLFSRLSAPAGQSDVARFVGSLI